MKSVRSTLDIRWNRRLRFIFLRLGMIFSFSYLSYVWFDVLQPEDITEIDISVKELRNNITQGHHTSLEAAVFTDEFRLSWNDTQNGNKNFTQHPNNVAPSEDGCPQGWHLETILEANDHQPTAQLCRIDDGTGHWMCAPGWRKIPAHPFCVAYLTKPVRQPNYAQVSDSRKLLFIHVPKAGGTSIETSFLFKEQREKLGGRYLGGHHKIIAFDEEFFKSYHKFAIVRHPCSRLISVWSYYSQGLGNKGDRQWADKFLDNETKSSFDAFVERTLYPDGPVHVDNQLHLQTQVGMLFDKEGHFGLDQLLIFEKWGDSMDELGKRINVNVTALKSTHRLSSRHTTCRESYTPKTWAKMTQVYAMDFCVLGYSTDFESDDLTPPMDLTPETLTSHFHECVRKTKKQIDSS